MSLRLDIKNEQQGYRRRDHILTRVVARFDTIFRSLVKLDLFLVVMTCCKNYTVGKIDGIQRFPRDPPRRPSGAADSA